jgi:hypothetical protein
LLGNRELSRQAGERSALIRSPFALAKQQGTGISRKVKKELDAACITPALDPEKGRGDVLSESGLGMARKSKLACFIISIIIISIIIMRGNQ